MQEVKVLTSMGDEYAESENEMEDGLNQAITASRKATASHKERQAFTKKLTIKLWHYMRYLQIGIVSLVGLIVLSCVLYFLFCRMDVSQELLCVRCGNSEVPSSEVPSAEDDIVDDATTTEGPDDAVIVTLSPWHMFVKDSFNVIIGSADFHAIIFSQPMTFKEMSALCDLPRQQFQTSSYRPIRNITRMEDSDFLKSFGEKVKPYEDSILEPNVDEALIWTGAYFDLTEPLVLQFSPDEKLDSLNFLEQDLCPESRDYRDVITASYSKIERLANEQGSEFNKILLKPQRVHITLKYSRGGAVCLHLYDADVGHKSDSEDTALIPACQLAFTGLPHASRYFPRIIERQVNFADARKLCSPLQTYKYDLSALDQANLMFLRESADIVAEIQGDGVWVGGFLDLNSKNPYLVNWVDKRVSDSLKSPKEIWCQGQQPEVVIPSLLSLKNRGDLMDNIVPIVRLKNQSNCLSLYSGLASETIFYPLCVTDEIYLSLGSDVMIPELYEGLFDKDNLRFVDLNGRYSTLSRVRESGLTFLTPDKLPANLPGIPPELARGNIPAVLAGFREQVTYNYAEALCTHAYYNAGSPRGALLTNTTLNNKVYSMLYSHIIAALRDRLLPLPRNSPLTTSVRFDLRKGYNDFISYDGSKEWAETLNMTEFPWCDDVNPAALLRETHEEFYRWFSGGGNLTTGPNYVYLAVEARNSSTTCTRLITEDLYWPGSLLWAPLCECKK